MACSAKAGYCNSMRLFQILLALLLPLLLTGCEGQPAQALSAPVSSNRPALWQVTAAGKSAGKIYLFGTIHLLPPDTDWQSANVDRAIDASDSLTIEVTGLDDTDEISKVFSAMALTPGLPPITVRIDPKLRPQFDSIVGNTKAKIAELNRIETWAATLRIIPLTSADIGLSPDYAVETVLQQRFAAAGKPVLSMETLRQQFSYFDNLPEADQRKMLNAVLKTAGGQKKQAERLLKAWLHGDQASIRNDAQSGILASPVLREALLDGRNRRWAGQIAGWLDQNQNRFVAVGAGHLAGPKGVPALLAAKGYTVTRIQ
jgi:uncharacterized protein